MQRFRAQNGLIKTKWSGPKGSLGQKWCGPKVVRAKSGHCRCGTAIHRTHLKAGALAGFGAVEGPCASNTTKISRENPQEREETMKNCCGRGTKKSEILALHPSGLHFSGFAPSLLLWPPRSAPSLPHLPSLSHPPPTIVIKITFTIKTYNYKCNYNYKKNYNYSKIQKINCRP